VKQQVFDRRHDETLVTSEENERASDQDMKKQARRTQRHTHGGEVVKKVGDGRLDTRSDKQLERVRSDERRSSGVSTSLEGSSMLMMVDDHQMKMMRKQMEEEVCTC
jgi:hypothetical protein